MYMQSIFYSKASGITFSLISVGTLAWYTHLFGLPFVPEAKAMTAAEHGLHAPAYPWAHRGPLDTFDHAAYVLEPLSEFKN